MKIDRRAAATHRLHRFSGAARDWWAGHSLYVGREFFYSPSFAVAMTPFAVWPDWLGGVLWTWASCGLLCLRAAGFLSRGVAGAVWPRTGGRQFLLLVLIGTVRSVWSGQSNALLVAMVLLAAAEIVRGRWWRGALWLAAPIHIKVWPVVAGGLFAAQSPRRLAARLTLCVVGLGLIPFLTQSPTGWSANTPAGIAVWRTGRPAAADTPAIATLGRFGSKSINRSTPGPILCCNLRAGLGHPGWCLWQRRRGLPTRQLAMYTIAAWSVWQLLFGPGTERLTYNLIAPALAWGVLTCFYSQAARNSAAGDPWQRLWITTAYLTTYLLGIGGVERLLTRWWPAATALEPVGVLIFAAWLVWHGYFAGPWPDEAAQAASTETGRALSQCRAA